MSSGDGPVVLSREELEFLRFVSNITAEPESPFARLPVPSRAEETRAGRESLVTRKLVDPRTLRPDRDLLRRLLVVSEPDAHVRLTSLRRGTQETLVDAYERSGAQVNLERPPEGYALSAAGHPLDLREQIARHLPVRGSAGDFARIQLTALEYLAFCLLAGRSGPTRQRSQSDVLLTPRLERGIESLLAKDLAVANSEGPQLRPFLADVGRALAARERLHLSRTDFGAHEWLLRDVTFIAIPGSLYQLQVAPTNDITLVELDAEAARRVLSELLEPPSQALDPALTA